jgi:hypothetical protein
MVPIFASSWMLWGHSAGYWTGAGSGRHLGVEKAFAFGMSLFRRSSRKR